jgi:hypothetical protein
LFLDPQVQCSRGWWWAAFQFVKEDNNWKWCTLCILSACGFAIALLQSKFTPFLFWAAGPPESIFDWTREIDSELSNQNVNNQAFSRKHWRLLQCQDGMISRIHWYDRSIYCCSDLKIKLLLIWFSFWHWQDFVFLKNFLKLITLCVIFCPLFSWCSTFHRIFW